MRWCSSGCSAMDERRARAWAALELGPVWRERAGGHEAGAPDLESLRQAVASCRACALCQTRTQTVFGVGPEQARWMIVGEAPGADEDARGEPFVGQAGKLLDDMLAAAGRSRARDVYIANVLKCRPPGNRDPRPDEIDACKGYLRRQLELVEPAVVVTLGNFATKLLLKTETGITRMRGQRYRWWRGIIVVPTFHPAAALRGRPDTRAAMQQDFALVRATLDTPGWSESPEEPPAS